jgi:kynureninase
MSKESLMEIAAKMDAADPLRTYASFFPKSDSRLIYFDGNSLGMLPGAATGHLRDVIERQWGQRLIRAYNEGWWMKPSDLGSRIAPLIGASGDEVIVCDSVSVNMFKMLVAALKNSGDKKKVVSDELNFGTDLYVIQGVIDLLDRGHRLELMSSDDGITVSDTELESSIDNDTALVSLSYVSFRSSFMYDMDRVTALAHSKGAYMLWDLCHAVGAVPINLNDSNADFAVGCTYKYLNGGPGSTSFLYVRKDLQEKLFSPVWGWWADADPFSFNTSFRPTGGMRKYLAGSVPVLSSSAMESSLDIFEMAGIQNIRRKSVEMSSFFLTAVGEYLQSLGFRPGSPAKPEMRGSHVSIKHKEAFRICKALIDDKEGDWTIIPDYRAPDNIRIGFAPLYNSFTEIAILTNELIRIVEERVYEKYGDDKEEVT